MTLINVKYLCINHFSNHTWYSIHSQCALLQRKHINTEKNDRLDEMIIANFNRIFIQTIIKSSASAQIWIVLCQKLKHCGIITVHKGPMFVAFVSYHCTRINIHTNVCASICLVFVCKIEPATYEITSPRTRKILANDKH